MPKPDWFGESIVFPVVNPAAGASCLIQPPAGTMWHVLSISANFTCSAAVADRRLYIAHVNGLVDTGLVFNGTAFAALGTAAFECSSLFTGASYNVIGHILFPLGPLCYLNNTVYLRLGVDGIQAADQISAIAVTCERMLEE